MEKLSIVLTIGVIIGVILAFKAMNNKIEAYNNDNKIKSKQSNMDLKTWDFKKN